MNKLSIGFTSFVAAGLLALGAYALTQHPHFGPAPTAAAETVLTPAQQAQLAIDEPGISGDHLVTLADYGSISGCHVYRVAPASDPTASFLLAVPGVNWSSGCAIR